MEKTRRALRIIFGLTLVVAVLFASCKKKDNTTVGEPSAPSATTNDAGNIGQGWATLNGAVNPNNLTTIVLFEYDTSTAYRYSVKGVPDTIADNKVTAVMANISGLLPGTKYHFRIKAGNQAGITSGADKTFTTTRPGNFEIKFNPGLTYGTLSDIDGNIYKTIVAGAQEWMAENLRAVKLNDGTPLPFTPDIKGWSSLSGPGYCWYNNDSLGYGALYNWYTVNTGKICPDGWHVPTDAEWSALTDYLGGAAVAGGKLKEAGTLHWNTPNTGATNESGLSAIPAGYRNPNGFFSNAGRLGYWWSSTETASTDAFYRALGYGYANIDRSSTSKKSGLSLRCVKDM